MVSVPKFPIFRVPEYSEFSVRPRFPEPMKSRARSSELGIFLPVNLPAEVEVDCRSLKIKSSEGTRICVAAGPAIKNGRGKRVAKAHLPARGFKADDAHWTFSPLF